MFWRSQADFDTYNQLLEKTRDPRWDLPRVTVEADPRSRFFDPHNPDCPPLPPDDPAAHDYMHWVDGMTLEEVAEACGLSVSGVRKRLRTLKGKAGQLADPVPAGATAEEGGEAP